MVSRFLLGGGPEFLAAAFTPLVRAGAVVERALLPENAIGRLEDYAVGSEVGALLAESLTLHANLPGGEVSYLEFTLYREGDKFGAAKGLEPLGLEDPMVAAVPEFDGPHLGQSSYYCVTPEGRSALRVYATMAGAIQSRRPEVPTMARKPRAVGVVRVSKVGRRRNDSETGERFRSPEEQDSAIRELAERLGLELVAVYEDLNLSGGIMDRPGLNAAVSMIQNRQASVLLVAWLDRFSRDVKGGLATLDVIEEAGGSLYAGDFELDTREPDGRMMLQFYLAISERERRVKGKRMAMAAAAANLEGIPVGHLPPGFKRGQGRRIVVDKSRARLVEPLFRKAAAGDSYGVLSSWWRHKTGEDISHDGIKGMLSSRLYLGELSFDGVVSPVRHTALVDEELYNSAQRVRKQNPPRKGNPPALLAGGVLICSGCNHPMTPASNGAGRFYRCQSAQNVSWTCPRPVAISLEKADAWVESELLRWAGHEEAVTTGDYAGAFEEADALVASTAEELARNRRIILASGADEAEAAAELAEYRQAHEAAKAARAELELEQKAAGVRYQVRQEWEAGRLSLEQKRRYLRAALESVVVHPAPLTERGRNTRAPVSVRMPPSAFTWTA